MHIPNFKTAFDDYGSINIRQFINFIKNLKSEFEVRLADFQTVENVVKILKTISFNLNKAPLQMEIIEFPEDLVLKEKFNRVSNTGLIHPSSVPRYRELLPSLRAIYIEAYQTEKNYNYNTNNDHSVIPQENVCENHLNTF